MVGGSPLRRCLSATAFVVLLLPFFLVPDAWAQGGKRIALLIGNKDYRQGVGALVNPLNGIRLVGEALRKVGLDVLKNSMRNNSIASDATRPGGPASASTNEQLKRSEC